MMLLGKYVYIEYAAWPGHFCNAAWLLFKQNNKQHCKDLEEVELLWTMGLISLKILCEWLPTIIGIAASKMPKYST